MNCQSFVCGYTSAIFGAAAIFVIPNTETAKEIDDAVSLTVIITELITCYIFIRLIYGRRQ